MNGLPKWFYLFDHRMEQLGLGLEFTYHENYTDELHVKVLISLQSSNNIIIARYRHISNHLPKL